MIRSNMCEICGSKIITKQWHRNQISQKHIHQFKTIYHVSKCKRVKKWNMLIPRLLLLVVIIPIDILIFTVCAVVIAATFPFYKLHEFIRGF